MLTIFILLSKLFITFILNYVQTTPLSWVADAPPQRQPPYRDSPTAEKEIEAQVSYMLANLNRTI